MLTTTDSYVRTVKGLAIRDARTYELQIDLGFGILHRHVVRLSAPILDGLPESEYDLLRDIFSQPNVVVTVATERPTTSDVPTRGWLFINGEPLEQIVARRIAARTGEVAL